MVSVVMVNGTNTRKLLDELVYNHNNTLSSKFGQTFTVKQLLLTKSLKIFWQIYIRTHTHR